MPGWKPLIVCNGPDCGFNDLLVLFNNLITDIVILATYATVAVLVYAGVMFITSGGDTGKRARAKHALWSVVKGYIVILAAWLLVYTIASVLFKDGYFILGSP